VPNRHDPSIKARAIRLVREHRGDYPSEFAAIKVVAGRPGMTPETLRKWIRQAEVDEGTAPGTSTAEPAQVRELKRKNRELEQTIEILKAARGFSRGSTTRDRADLSFRRREEAGIRGRTGLPCAFSARDPGCPAHVLGISFAAPSKRELRDAPVTEIMAGIYERGENGRRLPESMYGTLKMREYLQRQGIPVAKCTVERLKNEHGWHGRTRGRRVRTTIADPAAPRAPDLVNRHFTAARPGQLHVADFTYVPLAGGRFCYTAFVIDACAGLITGWECSASKETGFIESAVIQGTEYRKMRGQQIAGYAIHHSDAGSQHTSIHFGETLMLEGLTPSIGTAGDAYDNALAETTTGLYKTECIQADSPFRNGPLETVADVEKITSAWVHWYNTARLMHRLSRRPPAEPEHQFWAALDLTREPSR
jgi:putative transposase